jgi:hypothetical protein
MRLEGLGQLKNPMTSGIKPATFSLIEQCLNQVRCSLTPRVRDAVFEFASTGYSDEDIWFSPFSILRLKLVIRQLDNYVIIEVIFNILWVLRTR